jgi:hypothetical protein
MGCIIVKNLKYLIFKIVSYFQYAESNIVLKFMYVDCSYYDAVEYGV